ncbi:MAG: hypothetical protein LUF68_01930, partial [Clostridiales bacterium]|nr:hypothetical protein [Clostridiales bacterium]
LLNFCTEVFNLHLQFSDKVQFTLSEVYDFRDELKRQHPDNHNIEAKIRQQLQVLHDKGILEFVDRGVYRKI